MTVRKRSIALVIDRMDPSRGGAEAYLDRLGRHLLARGHAVAALAGTHSREEAPYERITIEAERGGRRARERGFLARARAETERRGFDAVLAVRHISWATVYNPHGGVFRDALARSAASSGPKLVAGMRLALRRLQPTVRHFLAVEEEMARSSCRIVAVSRLVANRLHEVLGVSPGRIRVIENGVDLDRFSPSDKPRGEGGGDVGFRSSGPRLLFVGHNFRLKGLASALRVLLRLLASPGEASLVVVGCGHERPFRELARRLGVESRVSFRGASDHAERYYRAADVLLHPTYYDPCSLVVLEAMASGLPVVTTRWNGASEQLVDLPGALVVEDPHRIDEMARGILELVSNRDLHDEARRAVRTRAECHPWEEKLRAMAEVLLEGSEAS